MRVDRGVSISRKVLLGIAGIGSVVLLMTTIVGVLPVWGDTTTGGGFGSVAFQFATIPQGKASVTVNAGVQLTPTTAAICTLQSDPGPRTLKYAAVNSKKGTYTVYLDQSALKPVKVACIVEMSTSGISGPVSPPVSGPISKPKS